MGSILQNNGPAMERMASIKKLSTIRQLELIAESRDCSLECRLAGAAVAVTISRIIQLSREDQEALWECVKDFNNIESSEDATETMETILEILEPEKTSSELIPFEISRNKPETIKNWLAYVSAKIRELRVEKGLSQEELADLTGLAQSHISRLERGVHSPSHKTLKKLAETFGVNVNQLDPAF